MTDWKLRPHEGVGPLELGMPREECRAAFEGRFEEYVKGPSDDRTTDIFAGAVHVVYDGVTLLDVAPATAVAAVERAAPYDPDDPELGYRLRLQDARPVALAARHRRIRTRGPHIRHRRHRRPRRLHILNPT